MSLSVETLAVLYRVAVDSVLLSGMILAVIIGISAFKWLRGSVDEGDEWHYNEDGSSWR